MGWYFPHIPLLLLTLIVWATKETLRTGYIDHMAIRVRRAEKPVTYWAMVGTQLFWAAAMIVLLGMWMVDLNGMRTG